MKNLSLLILLLGIICSTKSFGQIKPKLTEKRYELYSYNTEKYYLKNQTFFEYYENGDTLSIIKKIYDLPSGDIFIWSGDFFEYDNQNRLIKKNNKRYNPEVDLWISNYWTEYFYDDEGCIVQEIVIYNLGNIFQEWNYEVDENCKRLEGIRTDELDNKNLEEYIYSDENNSLITIQYYLDSVDWKKNFEFELIKNEEGDVIRKSRMLLNEFDPPDDTAFYAIELYDYNYIKAFNTNQISTKIQKYYNNSNTSFSPPYEFFELIRETRSDYEYYCDGLVFKEVRRIGGALEPISRYVYSYEGKNDCFDFEQDFEIMFSPNPSSGEIGIKSLIFESGETELQVFSTRGQLVFEKLIASRSHDQNVDLSVLKNGIYMIQLRSGKHFSTSKLVIAK